MRPANRATPTYASATLGMPSKKRKQRELAKVGKVAQPLSAYFKPQYIGVLI